MLGDDFILLAQLFNASHFLNHFWVKGLLRRSKQSDNYKYGLEISNNKDQEAVISCENA